MSGAPFQQVPKPDRPAAVRVAGRVLYWLAVFVISLAILYGLIRYLESRDNSQVGRASGGAATQRAHPIQPPRRSQPQPPQNSPGGAGVPKQQGPTTLGPAG